MSKRDWLWCGLGVAAIFLIPLNFMQVVWILFISLVSAGLLATYDIYVMRKEEREDQADLPSDSS